MTNMLLNPSSSSTHSHHHHHHHNHHHQDLEQAPAAPALSAPQPQPSEDDESRSSGGGCANNNCSIIINNGKGKRKLPLEGNPEEASGAAGGGGGGGAQTGRKPRGRPPGSKNKPKCPIYVDRQDAMRSHVLEVAAGYDVVECIATFGQRRQVGLCVMSASGSVCNVSLQQQSMIPASVLPGKFDILSLSGMFLLAVPGSPFPAQQQQRMLLQISLANAQGHVVGGTVAGRLLAAGPVTLMVAAVTSPSYHRVPEDDSEENAAPAPPPVAPAAGKQVVSASVPVSVAPPAVSGAQACQLTMYGSPNIACQIAPEIFHWAQHGHHSDRQHF